MVEPVLPPVGPPVDPPPIIPFAPALTTTTSDDLSTYSADLAAGKAMTIVEFSSIILSNTNEAKETAWAVQQNSANARNDLYEASIKNALDILVLYRLYMELAAEYSQAYHVNNDDIDAVNPFIVDYNSDVPDDIDAVNDINAAITAFNNGSITQSELQDAIDDYNAYALSRQDAISDTNDAINEFNDQVETTNGHVNHVNNGLGQSGAGPLESQDSSPLATELPILDDAPASPPFDVEVDTPSAIPIATNTMNGKGNDDPAMFASELFQPLFALLAGQIPISELLQAQSNFQGFVQFNLNNILPFVPASFYQPVPDLKLSSGSAPSGAGSGVSLGTIVTGLSSSLMESIISAGMFTANTNAQKQPITPNVVDQLQYLGLTLLSKVGLLAGSSAVRLINGRLPFVDVESSPVLAALGFSYADEIRALVASGAVGKAVKEIVEQEFPGLSPEQQQALIDRLTNATELFILEIGLLQLAQTLKSPDILDQIFSTLPTSESTRAKSKNADILKDEILKENVINDVIKRSNLQSDIVRKAVNASIAKGQFNLQAFLDEIASDVVESQESIDARIVFLDSLRSERVGREVLNKKVSNEQLTNSVLANEFVKDIVDKQPDITNRELRDRLADEFVKNGATQQEAFSTATTAVLGPSYTPLPVASFSTQLNATAQAQISGLGLTPDANKAFADQVINAVLGPNVPGSQTSFRDLIDERTSKLINTNDANIADALQDNFNSFLAPTYSLSVFADQLRDPANTFLYIAQVGLMYAHPQPSNFIKGTDIPV